MINTKRSRNCRIQETRRSFLRQTALLAAGLMLPAAFTRCEYHDKPSGDIVLRFLTASDGHFDNTGFDARYHSDLLNWIKEEASTAGLDFFIHLGDMGNTEKSIADEIQAVKKLLFDEIRATLNMPAYAARGNHDFLDDAEWRSMFNHAPDHAFEMGDYGFVIAGSTEGKTGTVRCLDPAEYAWLADTLRKFSDKKYVFFFSHIYPGNDIRGGEVVNQCPEVIELLHKTENVIAAYHGHMHLTDYVIARKCFDRSLYHCFHGHMGETWGVLYRGYRITEIYRDGTVYTCQYNPASKKAVNSNTLVAGS